MSVELFQEKSWRWRIRAATRRWLRWDPKSRGTKFFWHIQERRRSNPTSKIFGLPFMKSWWLEQLECFLLLRPKSGRQHQLDAWSNSYLQSILGAIDEFFQHLRRIHRVWPPGTRSKYRGFSTADFRGSADCILGKCTARDPASKTVGSNWSRSPCVYTNDDCRTRMEYPARSSLFHQHRAPTSRVWPLQQRRISKYIRFNEQKQKKLRSPTSYLRCATIQRRIRPSTFQAWQSKNFSLVDVDWTCSTLGLCESNKPSSVSTLVGSPKEVECDWDSLLECLASSRKDKY